LTQNREKPWIIAFAIFGKNMTVINNHF